MPLLSLSEVYEDVAASVDASSSSYAVFNYLKNIYHQHSRIRVTSLPEPELELSSEEAIEAIILLLKLPNLNGYFKILLYNYFKLEQILHREYTMQHTANQMNLSVYQNALKHCIIQDPNCISEVYTIDITGDLDNSEPVLNLLDLAYQIPSLHGIAYIYPKDTSVQVTLLQMYGEDVLEDPLHVDVRTINALFINFLKEKLFCTEYLASVSSIEDIVKDISNYITVSYSVPEQPQVLKIQPTICSSENIVCTDLNKDTEEIASEHEYVQRLVRSITFSQCTIEKIEIHIHVHTQQ